LQQEVFIDILFIFQDTKNQQKNQLLTWVFIFQNRGSVRIKFSSNKRF